MGPGHPPQQRRHHFRHQPERPPHTFGGGGTAYSPVQILRQRPAQYSARPAPARMRSPAFTAIPYSYTITAAANVTPQSNKFDVSCRLAATLMTSYFQDAWKKFLRAGSLTYGLRYESQLFRPIPRSPQSHFRRLPPSMLREIPPQLFLAPGALMRLYTFNPQPIYPTDWRGFDRA